MPEPSSDAWAHIRYAYEHTSRTVEDICADHGISSATLRDRMRRWRWTRRRPPIPRDGPPAVAWPHVDSRLRSSGDATNTRAANSDCSPPPPAAAFGGAGTLVCGEGLGVGVVVDDPKSFTATPLPNPPPQGGREQSEFAASEAAHQAQASVEIFSDPAAIAQRLQSAAARVLPAIEAIIARLAAGPRHPREMEQAGRALGALTRTLRELNALLSQQKLQAPQPYDDMPEDLDAFREALAQRIDALLAEPPDDAANGGET